MIQVWHDACLLASNVPNWEGQCVLPHSQWVACVWERSPESFSGQEQSASLARSEKQALWQSALSEEAWLASAEIWHHPWLRMTLRGFSMGAMIPEGAEIAVAPISPSTIEVGQVVVWANEQRDWVAHRVVERHPSRGSCSWIVTQGDVRRTADAPVSVDRLLGRVEQVNVKGKTWHPEHWASRWRAQTENRLSRWKRGLRRRLPNL
ncbi:MAG: hypothetical protein EP343_05260 [Deltaproteobacteria bacterium]|nr:MAG: hypothetical protein EP343_05260 [Deltaproteobacteria bacterium]